MTTTLNEHSYEFAQTQVKNGNVVLDRRDDWSEHQPSTRQENDFIEARGWDEYANWHLGIDDEASEHTKARYKFPYGDFARVHRCGVLSAEVRAGRNHYCDIEDAAALAAEGTSPSSDLSGQAGYRRHLARVLTRSAVLAAAGMQTAG